MMRMKWKKMMAERVVVGDVEYSDEIGDGNDGMMMIMMMVMKKNKNNNNKNNTSVQTNTKWINYI